MLCGTASVRFVREPSAEESDRIMRDTLFIGVYPGLTDEMMEFIDLNRFKEFFDSHANK